MWRRACLLALALAASSAAVAQEADPAAAAAPAAAPAADEDSDDIMKEIREEQARQQAAEDQAKAQERARRQQARDAAEQAKIAAEDAQLGPVVAAMQFTVTKDNRQMARAAQVHEGEDAAVAALRFCERYSLLSAEWLQSIAKQLGEKVAADKPDYKPKEGLVLKSAGAHKKRAKEAQKDGEYDVAIVDLIRALSRKGLEDDVKAQMERSISDALRGLRSQRQAEEKEAKAAAKAAEAEKLEAEAMAEAAARKQLDEEDWARFANDGVGGAAAAGATEGEGAGEGGAAAEAEDAVVAEVGLTLTNQQTKQPTQHNAKVMDGQDAHAAAVDFCLANSMHSAEQVHGVAELLKNKIDASDYKAPGHLSMSSAAAYIKRGKESQAQGQLLAAAADFTRAYSVAGASPAEKQEADGLARAVIQLRSVMAPFEDAFKAKEWDKALKIAERVPQQDRANARLLLMEARCHQQLGKFSNAQRASARVLEAAASYGSWKRGEPRMMAVTLGSNAAMELGNSEKALKFYKTVLKYDPDQKEIRAQYKKLKEVVGLLEDAEKQVTKGYNHKAVDKLDEVMSQLRGMDVDSNVFRSTILLKLCRAKAAMNQHEEALDHCEKAYAVLSTPMPGMIVDPHKLREAQEARAEAYMKDFNYDDAVSDLRAALEHASGEKQQEVQRKLTEAQNAQRKWRCIDPTDRKVWQENRCGHPNPQNGRDHKAVLELPANLAEIPKEKQCDWLKKQYKKLARKWHPDKAKGSKIRAGRKMNDVAEAKEVLDKQLGCKPGRSGRN